jgi:hypothetical protein
MQHHGSHVLSGVLPGMPGPAAVQACGGCNKQAIPASAALRDDLLFFFYRSLFIFCLGHQQIFINPLGIVHCSKVVDLDPGVASGKGGRS